MFFKYPICLDPTKMKSIPEDLKTIVCLKHVSRGNKPYQNIWKVAKLTAFMCFFLQHRADKRNILLDNFQSGMCEIKQICNSGPASLRLGPNDFWEFGEMANGVDWFLFGGVCFDLLHIADKSRLFHTWLIRISREIWDDRREKHLTIKKYFLKLVIKKIIFSL